MDTINLNQSYQTFNFIKNLKTRINNIENVKTNIEYLEKIENSFTNEEILYDIAVALLNYIWPISQENIRNNALKRFIKHVIKYSNTTILIYISAVYYLLNLKDNVKFNNLLKRIQLEIENTKQEQGFINDGNLNERCCNCCGAYTSCYKSDTIVCKCRLFLMSLVLACKFGQDKNYSNKAWSKISKFSVENINYNERFFLKLIDYRLYIKNESYQAFTSLIINHIINMKNQKKKLQYKELLNLSKINTGNVNNTQEWKKNLEKKTMLIRKIKQLEVIKQAKIKYQSIQNSSDNSLMNSGRFIGKSSNAQSSIQKCSPMDIRQLLNNTRYTELENNQKLLSMKNNSSYNNNNGSSIINENTIKCNQSNANNSINVAAISPISPSGLPISNINNNVNGNGINNVILNKDGSMKVNKTYLSNKRKLILPILKSSELIQNRKKEESQSKKNIGSQTNTQPNHLTLENFSSFMKFYSCIKEKLSSSDESVIKATGSYKVLEMALKLTTAKRVPDALKLLNHVIYGTMDICKEIISLALKGQKKNALIYIYLLTPSEIQYYNKNLKTSSLKSLTPQDVLSVVSILLNCVHKGYNSTQEVKNDLLANLGQESQVNNSSQNLLLKFIQNINNSLSSN
ncbi:hypothetical protein H8356DRAFT_1306908 [Neocallimastix lanati (nom. inval.)]|nr:hypothetical protein H8356DRAFT_1306908 [Neocallimastix sp. JGI-2020a]